MLLRICAAVLIACVQHGESLVPSPKPSAAPTALTTGLPTFVPSGFPTPLPTHLPTSAGGASCYSGTTGVGTGPAQVAIPGASFESYECVSYCYTCTSADKSGCIAGKQYTTYSIVTVETVATMKKEDTLYINLATCSTQNCNVPVDAGLCGTASVPSASPTIVPSVPPTSLVTAHPTPLPTKASGVSGLPTSTPTLLPTPAPSGTSSGEPTDEPTLIPTMQPSHPTVPPTRSPTYKANAPTPRPTVLPTFSPSALPTEAPTSTTASCYTGTTGIGAGPVETSVPGASFDAHACVSFCYTCTAADKSGCVAGKQYTTYSIVSDLTAAAMAKSPALYINLAVCKTANCNVPVDAGLCGVPTGFPTVAPTVPLTRSPTYKAHVPTPRPTPLPTFSPSAAPTPGPTTATRGPTHSAHAAPTALPTALPTRLPTTAKGMPSARPTAKPTLKPSTAAGASCYSGIYGLAPITVQAVPSTDFNGYVCVAYCFKCSATDTSGCTVGKLYTSYTIVSTTTLTSMVAAPTVYINLLHCSSDNCNVPSAQGQCPVPTSPPTRYPTTAATSTAAYRGSVALKLSGISTSADSITKEAIRDALVATLSLSSGCVVGEPVLTVAMASTPSAPLRRLAGTQSVLATMSVTLPAGSTYNPGNVPASTTAAMVQSKLTSSNNAYIINFDTAYISAGGTKANEPIIALVSTSVSTLGGPPTLSPTTTPTSTQAEALGSAVAKDLTQQNITIATVVLAVLFVGCLGGYCLCRKGKSDTLASKVDNYYGGDSEQSTGIMRASHTSRMSADDGHTHNTRFSHSITTNPAADVFDDVPRRLTAAAPPFSARNEGL